MKTLVLSCVGALTASALCGADLVAGYARAVNVTVPENATQEDNLILGDGELHKTGAGTLTIPTSKLAPFGAASRIYVEEGGLTISDDGTPAVPAVPAVILKEAAFWVSAKDGERQLTTADGAAATADAAVDVWRDVRDTDPAATNYWFAKTAFLLAAYPAPVFKNYSDVSGNARPAVYFGGYGSGTTMRWYDKGGTKVPLSTINVRHAFAVHCATKRMGQVFGYDGHVNNVVDGWYHAANYSDKNAWGAYCIYRSILAATRAYRNGEMIQPTVDMPKKNAFELYDINLHGHRAVSLNAFYCDRGLTDVPRVGGDYLSEMIVFTVKLSERERVAVENYLMAKWSLGGGMPSVTVASAGKAVVVAQDGRTVSSSDYQGSGTLELTGAGTVTFDTVKGGAPYSLALTAANGVKSQLRAPVPVKAASGTSVTASRVVLTGDSPRSVFATDAGAGSFAKKGVDEALVKSVPADVTELRVEEGRLILSPTAQDEATHWPVGFGGEVPLKNPSFETPPDGVTGAFSLWSTGYSRNIDGWTLATTASGNSWGAWLKPRVNNGENGRNLFFVGKAPDGECAVGLKMGATLSQNVTIPAAGKYFFSFWSCGRCDADWSGKAKVFLVDASTSPATTNVFCNGQRRLYWNQMCEYGCEATVDKAGTYKLIFTPGLDDVTMTIDDLHLRRVVTPNRALYRIPGGDFEQPTWTAETSYSSQNTHPNWAFAQYPGATDATPGVALANPLQNRPWCFAQTGTAENPVFQGRRLPEGGYCQLAFLTNGSASTTFTPPAGRWLLKANLTGRFGYSVAAGALIATVTPAGGAAVSLGDVTVPGASTDVTYPTAFVADGETSVTLTLAYTMPTALFRQVLVDDLELVAAGVDWNVPTELVTDGGFENVKEAIKRTYSKDWTICKADGTVYEPSGSGEIGVFLSTEFPTSYGPTYEGSYRLFLCSGYYVRQTVTFPSAGLYRLRFAVAARLDQLAADNNMTKAFVTVSEGAETNLSIAVNCSWASPVERVYDFYVPTPGPRELRFASAASANWQHNLSLDGVSVKAAPTPVDGPILDTAQKVRVASGAKLYLGFAGTNEVSEVRIGGVRRSGVLSAERFPDYIEGPGALYVEPKGLLLIFR